MILRPAQQAVLDYQGGRMAVSAVPGSGKTFTLSLLAAELIRSGRLDLVAGQNVLVVTYLNSSVETFRARIRARLEQFSLPQLGYEVRTLHSLALEIISLTTGGAPEIDDGPTVIDEPQALAMISLATDSWIEANPALWQEMLQELQPQTAGRWRNLIESTAFSFIREAKNHRYTPDAISRRIGQEFVTLEETLRIASSAVLFDAIQPDDQLGLMRVLAGIYGRYQAILDRQGLSDFDDLIWRAAAILTANESIAADFRARWPFVLEDEAQDSVPLQEILLSALTGALGNWVRVGDPNQAITSTFTSAHPRHFVAFMQMPDVQTVPLPNSGRCSPRIYGAANRLVDWVTSQHPVPEVRSNAFRRQMILPTPPGDTQPNPPDHDSNLQIKVYRHREEDELPAIAQLASRYAAQFPNSTVAILVPTNDLGHKLATHLDEIGTRYDDLLRGGTRIREIASALHWILQLLADPLDKRALAETYGALLELEHHVVLADGVTDHEKIMVILRSAYLPEELIYGASEAERLEGLPSGVIDLVNVPAIIRFAEFVKHLFQFRTLPVDDLILSISDELFAFPVGQDASVSESDSALAYQLAITIRQWWDMQPDSRLPDLATQLADVASGRRRLRLAAPVALGYKPQPGRITLATQHGSKGMEWDAVYLMGIDSRWIPGDLDGHFIGVDVMLGGNPAAEANAQLHSLMKGDAGTFPGRSATESAHIEVISERLRLLYVGITRARSFLHISRSKLASKRRSDYETEPATVMGVLYRYLKDKSATS